MATYYVDYAGSAGTGDGSSFANRASKMEDIWSSTTTLGATDEVRIKGNPITSLGTARIGDTSRSWWRTRYLNDTNLNGFVEYSTTTGETKLKFGTLQHYGWETGDRIFIIQDTGASSHSQPSLIGIHELTVVDDYTTSLVCKLDGYTANSNANGTTGSIKWMVLNTAIKLNTTGLFKNIACMDLDRSAWTVNGSQGGASIYSYPTNDTSLNCARWPSGSDELTIATAATVGKVAHYQLPSTLDLSGYQQVSFLVKVNSDGYGRRSETPDTLRLCTDTNGDTSVHTIPIDLKGSKGGTYYSFFPVTVDLGVNLNASIKSIALYREQTQAVETFWIQNVVACKNSSDADAITHSSCIGLKEANNPIWHHVDMLWEDWLIPASGGNFRSAPFTRYSHGGGYWSSNGSAVTVYKVEPIRIDTRNLSGTSGVFDDVKIVGSYSGSEANLTVSDLNTVSGGWNDTDMSSKSADYATIIQGDEHYRTLMQLSSSTKYLNFEDINFHRWDHSFHGNAAGGHNKFTSIGHWGCSLDGYHNASLGIDQSYNLGYTTSLGTVYMSQHVNSLPSNFNFHCLALHYNWATLTMYLSSNSHKPDWEWGTLRLISPGDRGYYYLRIAEAYSEFTKISNLISVGGCIDDWITVRGSGKAEIDTFTSTNGLGLYVYDTNLTVNQINMTRPVYPGNPNYNPVRWGLQKSPEAILTRSGYDYDCVINAGNIIGEINHPGLGTVNLDGVSRTGKTNGDTVGATRIGWRDYNGTANDHRTYFPNVDVYASTNSNILRTPSSGVALMVDGHNQAVPLGKIAVNANSQVTVSIWIRANNNASGVPTLRVKAAPYMGINSDQEVSYVLNSATSNTWVQLSKSFTPTAAGFLDVEVQNTGGTYQYYDDFEVTQV